MFSQTPPVGAPLLVWSSNKGSSSITRMMHVPSLVLGLQYIHLDAVVAQADRQLAVVTGAALSRDGEVPVLKGNTLIFEVQV